MNIVYFSHLIEFFVPFSYRSAAEILCEFLLLSHIIPHRLATFKDRWFHSFVKEATKFLPLVLSHPLPLSFLDLWERSSWSVGELWQPDADAREDSPFNSLSRCVLFCLLHSSRIMHHLHHLWCDCFPYCVHLFFPLLLATPWSFPFPFAFIFLSCR